MRQFVEAMEDRTFFSVTAATINTDLQAVQADRSSIIAALAPIRGAVAAVERAGRADLAGSSNRAQTVRLGLAFVADMGRAQARLAVAQASYLATSSALSAKVAADAKAVLAHPTNSRLTAILSRDVASLNATVPAKFTALQSVVQSAVATFNTDLNAIVAANPGNTKLANDAAVAEGSASSATGTYLNAASKLQTDAQTLASDASQA